MKKIIQFEESEFNSKIIEFSKNFINQSKKGFGCKLISNETGKVIEDEKEILGRMLSIWDKTFKCKE